jgi:hypothetical protein
MANVIDEEAVAVTPSVHVKVIEGSPIVMPERPVNEEMTGVRIGSQTKRVLGEEEFEGLPECWPPVEMFLGSSRRKEGIANQRIETAGPSSEDEWVIRKASNDVERTNGRTGGNRLEVQGRLREGKER